MKLTIPEGYQSSLTLKQTEKAIKLVKDFFQLNLSSELKLRRVTAPVFLPANTGINDDLNGTEKPVSFSVKDLSDAVVECPQSLAKWKRMMLADYEIKEGYGLYTDMNAIRPDEELTNLHSIYVDQWDWEKSISREDRTIDFLKSTVKKIYSAIRRTEFIVSESYTEIESFLPEEITFFYAEELLEMYPDLSPKERETLVTKKHKAVFIIGIGGELPDGSIHDGRAPDYDDWTTETEKGYKGLNGDILVWHPILEIALELSSMGIRVDEAVMTEQLKQRGCEDRKDLYWHKRLLNGEFPLSIGGGIGQSRLCMFFLRKIHVGEIQSSVWPEEMKKQCESKGVKLI